ncbi:glycosyltransferase involved in cell wall biosynthesis [Arthrobacter sp. PvP023]|uniref:glycosyltransferase family 2 protein n=1 Tax=Micrococcaceae TaxID=1268 RepID=UPI001AEB8024|nr:glycosyltransferase family 2 protein [Arthrobacter sp. PvP023]MBP1135640.1 glycosyltransferase involved in cell wall biosynthesis [Arthrobacter sp. PvP023]
MPIRTSFVMPLYNGGATVERAIRSVLAQDRDDWELLVVDDCSADNSRDLVEAFVQADGQNRIRLIRQERNGGPSAARNAGIAGSVGEFVGFLDCDDELLPNYLATMEANMADGIDIVVAAHVAQTPAGRRYPRPDSAQGLLTGLETVDAALQGKLWNFLHAKVYRRSLFDHFSFPDHLVRYEDLVVNSIAYSYSRQVRIVPTPVYVYHVQAQSLTWSQEPSMAFVEGPLDCVRSGLNPELASQIKKRSWNTLRTFLGVLTISGGLFAGSPKHSVDRIVRYVREELSFRDLADVTLAAPHLGLSGMLIKVFPALYAKLYLWHVRRTFDMAK